MYTAYNFLAVDKLNWSDKKIPNSFQKKFLIILYIYMMFGWSNTYIYVKITSLIT